MANLLPWVKTIFYDTDNVTPLANGSVYFYVAGSATPKDTFTDAGGGTPNANPVVLDANGTADIWLDTDQSYKIVIKDSAGATIKSIDNVFASSYTQLGANLDTNGYNIAFDDGQGLIDNNANELVLFGVTASAVNYAKVTNSATGNGVKVEAAGSDTNIDLVLLPKGTGALSVSGTTTYETSCCTSDDDIPNKKYVDDAIDTDIAALNLASTYLPQTAIDSAASQADMEAGTDTKAAITPATLKYGLGVAKAWAFVNNSGTPTLVRSHNVTSVTDQGVGFTDVNYTTSLSENYSSVGTAHLDTDFVVATNATASKVTVYTYDISAVALADSGFSVIVCGDFP